jgi:hypothetical protein
MTVLCVAAHPDDEVLGPGGTLARHTRDGEDVHVCILSDGVTSRYDDDSAAESEIEQTIEMIEPADNPVITAEFGTITPGCRQENRERFAGRGGHERPDLPGSRGGQRQVDTQRAPRGRDGSQALSCLAGIRLSVSGLSRGTSADDMYDVLTVTDERIAADPSTDVGKFITG